ncbi:hypothetical protein [Pseudomonas sp.]|uniref:hypothetical protein n=1 Tax=Pseudomonas sp. TaxID=306 RepID=UPI003C673076
MHPTRHAVVLRSVALMLSALGLTGCIHYEHKSAEGQPVAQVVTIQQLNKHLTITQIDDDTTLFWLSRQSEYRLGAGIHKIRVKWYFGEASTAPLETTVNLVGGRTYGLDGQMLMDRWGYDIRDVETGQSAFLIPQAAKTP